MIEEKKITGYNGIGRVILTKRPTSRNARAGEGTSEGVQPFGPKRFQIGFLWSNLKLQHNSSHLFTFYVFPKVYPEHKKKEQIVSKGCLSKGALPS